jgi:tetratricopeptide (TPR) repeat protein
MDGRFAQVAAPSLRSLCCFTLLLSGCTTAQTTKPSTDAGPTVSAQTSWWPWSSKKRVPKAETCVACAEMRLNTASNKDLTSAQVGQLRDEARRAYQQALKVDEKCLPAYLGLAKLYQDMDQPDRALETYQHGVKVLPKQAKLWYAMGMFQARYQHWDEAVAGMKKATELDPENFMYVNNYGFTLARAGRFDESYRYFAKTIGEAKAHYNVACVLHHVNRDDECRDHLRQALMAKPNLEPAQLLLAELQNPNAGAIQQTSYQGAEPALSVK